VSAVESTPTRERLLTAAVELFVERGYDGTTVGEIARRAGVTTGAIYAHFDDKGALLVEALADEALRAQRALTERLPLARSPRERALDVQTALITGPAVRYHRVLLQAWAAALHDDAARGRVQPIIDGQLAAIDEQMAAGRAVSRLDPDLDDTCLRTFFFALSAGSTVLKAFDVPRADPATMRAFLDRVFESMTAPPPPRHP
jgi:AcrR family transcriptional regulator